MSTFLDVLYPTNAGNRDWAISFGGLLDDDITQGAQGADDAQGVVHGDQGTQDSQEAQDVKYTPNTPDTPGTLDTPHTQGIQVAQDAEGTSLDASADAVDISVLAGLHTTDDVFGPQNAPLDVIESAQNGSQENVTLDNGVGYGLNPHGNDAEYVPYNIR